MMKSGLAKVLILLFVTANAGCGGGGESPPPAPVNTAPVADAGTSQSVGLGFTVNLDGSNSSDADGDTLTYSWVFNTVPAGSAAILSDPTAVQPSFVVDQSGDYVLELTVNDGSVDSVVDYVTVSTSSLVTAADYYRHVSNTVQSADLGNGEVIVAFYNFEFVTSGANQLFQIGVSRDNGQSYQLLMPDMRDVTSYITDGSSAYPRSIIYSDSTILVSVMYHLTTDSVYTNHPGLFIIDRNTLVMNFVAETPSQCIPIDGIQQGDGSWMFAGGCAEQAAVFSSDADFANINILDQLTSNSYGGELRSLLSATDGCIYAGGHNWENISTALATHMVVRKSCDLGVTWTSDLDFYNPGHAYSSIKRLYEFNGNIHFFGDLGEDPVSGTSTDVSVVTAIRNGVDNWIMTAMPGTTVPSSSPAGFIAFENASCNMVSSSLLAGFDSYYSLSDDCGATWSAPVATTFVRVTGLELKSGTITFYHYDTAFHVDQMDFATALSNLP